MTKKDKPALGPGDSPARVGKTRNPKFSEGRGKNFGKKCFDSAMGDLWGQTVRQAGENENLGGKREAKECVCSVSLR